MVGVGASEGRAPCLLELGSGAPSPPPGSATLQALGGRLGGFARPRHCVTSSQAEPMDPMPGPALRDLTRKSQSQESLGSPC